MTPRQTIFFGDAPNDEAAAKACSVDFVPINFLGADNRGFEKFLASHEI